MKKTDELQREYRERERIIKKQRHTDNIRITTPLSYYAPLALPIGIIESERQEYMWHVFFSLFVEKEIDTSTIDSCR